MLLHKHTPFLFFFFFLSLFFQGAETAYSHETCCKKAKADLAFVGSSIPSFENQTCGQAYSPDDLDPALPLYVTFAYCSANCGGMGLHKIDTPGSWAAPLVQFILPSIIFSMTIPRQHKIDYDYLFDWPKKRTNVVWLDSSLQLLISMCLFVLILLPVMVDTLLWMCTIIVGAGNMLIGGLYEAHLDYGIITYVLGLENDATKDTLGMKRELLVTIVSGNLKLDKGNPQKRITHAIIVTDPNRPKSSGHEKSRSRLLNLLGAQSSFGSAVGSPVLFYLGAFAYSILDLFNDPSSESSSISLGFGIEWMIIVHVAIVSGCLLASNNPSTSAGIVGSSHLSLRNTTPAKLRLDVPAGGTQTTPWTWKDFQKLILGWSNSYDTKFQPVSLWGRGSNKMRWVEGSVAFRKNHDSFADTIKIKASGWLFGVYIPCLLLIALPPATGGVVAYFTPPKGIACRSLSFIVYAACQAVLVTFATIRAAVDDGQKTREKGRTFLQTIFTGYGFIAISSLFWLGSLLSAVGGTLMQIVGIYDNCICYAGADSWWNIWRVHPNIQLATDTQSARDASLYWIRMGTTAAVFMAVNCYVGWWYQRLIRHRFQRAVKAMFVVEDGANGSESGEREGSIEGASGVQVAASEDGERQELIKTVDRLNVLGSEDGGRESLDSDRIRGSPRGGRYGEEWRSAADHSLTAFGAGVGDVDGGVMLQPLVVRTPGLPRPSTSSAGS